MHYFTYILKSTSIGRYYCGSTNDIDRRLKQHNDLSYTGSKTTKRFNGPWVLVWKNTHLSRGDAMKQEKQIKKRGISRFLESVESRF